MQLFEATSLVKVGCNKEKWKRCDEKLTSEKTAVWKVAAELDQQLFVYVIKKKQGFIFIFLIIILMRIFILYVVKWLESRQLWCLHVPVSPVTSGKNKTVHDHLVWFSNDANNNNMNNNNNLCNLINTHWKDTKRRDCRVLTKPDLTVKAEMLVWGWKMSSFWDKTEKTGADLIFRKYKKLHCSHAAED